MPVTGAHGAYESFLNCHEVCRKMQESQRLVTTVAGTPRLKSVDFFVSASLYAFCLMPNRLRGNTEHLMHVSKHVKSVKSSKPAS